MIKMKTYIYTQRIERERDDALSFFLTTYNLPSKCIYVEKIQT